ncbi:MAG: hypothetical protein LBS56_08830 [Propionibacteriaceae bacterium]|nr:hypothetical protein [Propionibacteriaceae bacterium]
MTESTDQVQISLSPAEWDALIDALGHPAPSPRFDRLMSEPSVLER